MLNLNVPNLPLHEVKGVREAELAPHGEVWIASADSSGGDLKLEFQGRADAAPGTDVALIRDGYVAVTPLMSVVRAPLTRRGRSRGVGVARVLRQVDTRCRRSSASRTVGDAFGHDAPPHPAAALLADDEPDLGEHLGVVRHRRLRLAERREQVARADLAGVGDRGSAAGAAPGRRARRTPARGRSASASSSGAARTDGQQSAVGRALRHRHLQIDPLTAVDVFATHRCNRRVANVSGAPDGHGSSSPSTCPTSTRRSPSTRSSSPPSRPRSGPATPTSRSPSRR